MGAVVDTSQQSNVIPFAEPRKRRPRRAEADVQATADMRIVLVEWRIKPGREAEFLDYWSRREVVPERDGLIGEFLSRVDPTYGSPWVTWSLDPRWTTFVNVGLWRNGDEFHDQIGYKIVDARPSMSFEAERRRRILVAPERWRCGGTPLPVSAHAQVL